MVGEENFGDGIMPEEKALLDEDFMDELEVLGKDVDEPKDFVEGFGEVYDDGKRREFKKEKLDGEFLEPQEELEPNENTESSENTEPNEVSMAVNERTGQKFTITEAKKMISDETSQVKRELRETLKAFKQIEKDYGDLKNYSQEKRDKLETLVESVKKYMKQVKEHDREMLELKTNKVINLENFNENEISGLQILFNNKLAVYEFLLRDVRVLSDKPMEKAKVFRASRKVIMSSMNVIDSGSLTYLKLKKVIEPTIEVGKKINMLYERHDKEEFMRDIIEEEILELLTENEDSVGRIIDIFLSIANKKETQNFDKIAGIRFVKDEAVDLYNALNNE